MKSMRKMMKRRSGGLYFGAMAMALLGTGAALGQNSGTIFGSVADQSGAIIPNATVTVADTEHGVSRTAATNGSGEYQIQNLPVGNYILTVDVASFATAVVTDIKVDAASSVKEQVVLQAGKKGETVTVEDTSGSAIDANSATLGTLIDQRLIEDLPIDGHNVVALAALLPGVTDVNAPTTFTGDTNGPTYSASGSRSTQNLLLFDGLLWNNLFYNTGTNYPTPNALQEVSVLLNNYKAEYGRNSGSVFNVLTKQGTNQLHGAVWDYLQNQIFDAADYISKVNPKNNINQFGFTVGGPVRLGKYYDGRDKLFFFGAFQQLIGRLQTTATAPTPGYAERGLLADGKTALPCTSNGLFQGLTCASFAKDAPTGKFINPVSVAGTSGLQASPSDAVSMLNTAYQVAGGAGQSPCVTELDQAATKLASLSGSAATYLTNQEIPTNCLNPVMSNIFNTFVPLPSVITGNAVTQSYFPEGDRNALIRFDYQANAKNRFDMRYNYVHSMADGPLGINSASQGIATYALVNQQAHNNFANVGWNSTITASLLNVMRVGYKRYESTQSPDDHRTLNSFGGQFVETGTPTLPAFTISNQFNIGGASTTGGSIQGASDHINEDVEVLDQVTYVRGNHSFKAGFDFLRLQYLNRADYPGQLQYSTTFTGVSTADAELGLVSTVNAQNTLIQGGIQHDAYFFLQDDWRITQKLTLNLGVRYEVPFQWFEPHGQSSTFIPGYQSHVFPGAPGGLAFPGDRGVLPSLAATDLNGVAPRVGFAYDTTGTGKFLVRGGFGVFFDAVNANVVGVGEPYHFLVNQILPPGGASAPLNGLNQATGGTLVLPGKFNPAHPVFQAPYSIFFPDANFRTPYVMAANFGFQYHVPHAGVFEANYVGKYSRKLTIPVDLNPAIYDCSGGYYQSAPTKYCASFQTPGGTAATTKTSYQSRVRYAPYNYGGQGIVDILSVGTASYNGLQVQYTQRGGKLLTIQSSYTYARSIDLQSNGQTVSNAVPNIFNIASDKGPSDSNATHVFSLGWVERFPKFTGSYAPVRTALNGWVYSGTFKANTGRPYNVTINNDSAYVGEVNQRPSLLPGINPKLSSSRHRADKVTEYFNREAFTYPVQGTFSTLGRNAFVGPGDIFTNMTLGRDFPLSNVREGMRLNFRAEGFNVFNIPNIANPYAVFSCSTTTTYTGSQGVGKQTNESCPAAGGSYPVNATTGLTSFGNIRSTYGNNANTSTNGRKMQFALTMFY